MRLFIRTLLSVLWEVKEEYLDFVKGFSPLTILLSLFILALGAMDSAKYHYETLMIWLSALPFGLLFFYAFIANIAIFYGKSMSKLKRNQLQHIRHLRQRQSNQQTVQYIIHLRRRYFKIAFAVIAGAVMALSLVILVMSYKIINDLYRVFV